MPSANEVANNASVIFTATASREPLITTKLQPGAVLVALGSDQPGKRELGEEVTNDATIICDDVPHAREAGETEFLSEEKFNSNVAGYCGDVFLGNVSRRDDSQSFVVDLCGVGTQDASIGDTLWQKIKASKDN